jgi:hypothetical protein
MVELDLVTLDREKIVRTLHACGVDPRVIGIIEELHDTTRVTQKLCEEMMEIQKKQNDALALLTTGYKGTTERLQAMEKKYGTSSVTDILKAERE